MLDQEDTDPNLTGPRHVLAELCAGFAMILAVIAVLFGFATGIGVQVPWEVFIAIAVLGLGLCGAARAAIRALRASSDDEALHQTNRRR